MVKIPNKNIPQPAKANKVAPKKKESNISHLVKMFKKKVKEIESDGENSDESESTHMMQESTMEVSVEDMIQNMGSNEVNHAINAMKPIEKDVKIILDSGASTHMFTMDFVFENFVSQAGVVRLGSKGHEEPSIGKGDIGILKGVLCVPNLRECLVSTGKLSQDGYVTVFKKDYGYVYEPNDKMMESPVVTSVLDHGLYYVNDFKKTFEYLHLNTDGSAPKQLKSSAIGLTALEALHKRWGHLSEKYIKQAIKQGMIDGAGMTYDNIKNKYMRTCFDCLKGRMKRLEYPPSVTDHTADKPFHIVCSDIKGPFPVKSSRNNRYFINFVDTKTGYVTVYYCKKLDDVKDIIKQN